MLVRCYRARLSVWAVLCVLVLCWFYVYPVYRLPRDKDIVEEVLRQGEAWQKNQTGIDLYRKLLTECCDPKRMFAVTKENSPMGKVLWYDGEFYHSHTVNNETYSLFVQERELYLLVPVNKDNRRVELIKKCHRPQTNTRICKRLLGQVNCWLQPEAGN